ncbi:hypothetical protein [Halopenitus persicus]|uniref:PD-(D/E)XK nuclease superfamily protein n=1 Tax=Halopenitus persicus TaxID=1048396 RepID=A0A1H3P910_9EURY|nr:hypothetical protein [Halopenitus persicus]SDY97577.1 hypothetical protein SAMN05216564_12116 [Halopenitus persicus]
MDIENGESIASAGEQEVDFILVQLLETSVDFRQWLVRQAVPELEISRYLGSVMHATYAGEGESDVEFGFRSVSGDRHLVLIEDKIDASKQPDQVERYFNRGQYRVDRGSWDSFTVCLVAPESYVSDEDEAEFDSILRYEDVLDYLEDATHDSAAFFSTVFESGMRRGRSPTTDASGVLQSIADQFQTKTEISDLVQTVDLKKRAGFRSTHPQHPDAVQYDVYIGETGESGRSTVRLQIASIEGLTDSEREALTAIASQHVDSLSNYEWHPHRKKNIINTKVWHEDAVQDPEYDSYVDAIVDELITLSETFHPLFVENSID